MTGDLPCLFGVFPYTRRSVPVGHTDCCRRSELGSDRTQISPWNYAAWALSGTNYEVVGNLRKGRVRRVPSTCYSIEQLTTLCALGYAFLTAALCNSFELFANFQSLGAP